MTRPHAPHSMWRGNWKTLLIIGQGYGGTFYQAFDVTEAGMGVAQDADGLSAVSSMLGRFDAPDESITFEWSFPKYHDFDPTINYTSGTLTDGYPGGQVKFYGDLKPTASNAEKRVGFTFSDPAVTLTIARSGHYRLRVAEVERSRAAATPRRAQGTRSTCSTRPPASRSATRPAATATATAATTSAT